MKLFKRNRKVKEIWYCDHIREDGTIERIYDDLQIEAIERATWNKGLRECWWINNKGEKFDSFKPMI